MMNISLNGSSTSMHLLLSIQSLALFLLPLLLYKNGRRTLHLAFANGKKLLREVRIGRFLMYVGIILGGSAILGELSEQLVSVLPESWGIAQEDSTAKLITRLLKNHSPLYLVELFSICLLPAIVEELFFRATLQRYMLLGFARPLVAILMTALIFSLAHISVVGLLSRLWIGLVLGLVYYKSENIYLPISLHFINNLTALILLIGTLE